MKDEEYVFMQDIREKKSIARGAFHKKGGSKSKKCTLPSDYLTRKEREKMNGEVKRWNMNEFYTWQEFKEMPKDIAAAYISTLNQKYRVSVGVICSELFHKSKTYVNTYLHKNGIVELMKTKPYTNRGNTKVIEDFKQAIEDAKNPRVDISENIFIPDGMAPGYCSDGTKVEDAIKKTIESVNKKLVEDANIRKEFGVPGTKVEDVSVSSDGLLAGMDSALDFSYDPNGKFISLPYTLPKPNDEPEKEHPSISSLSFVMHGVDKERIADILSWFEGKDVTITLNITKKM